MHQIAVEDLVKTYTVEKRQSGIINAFKGLVHRNRTIINALEGISFTVDSGELVGYIGPNGAGKSTTVKILSGILVPDSGRCEVMGRTPWRQRIAHVSNIGVVFGQRSQLWWDLPVIDSFELLRDIYRIPAMQYNKCLEELVSALSITDIINTPVRQLSLGQRMRCELAASLLHRPRLLFLDEPTIGLDAVSKLAVRDFIKRMNREHGMTVVLTTHDMDDVESLCSRIMVIGKGKLLFDGTLDRLQQTVCRDRLLIVDISDDSNEIPLIDAKVIKRDGPRIYYSFDPTAAPPSKLIAQLSMKCAISDLWIENQPIEETIAKFYGDMQL